MSPELMRERFEESLRLAGPTHSMQDVIEEVRAGRAQFWSNDDATIVTEIVSYPLLKVISFWLISGELKAALALEPEILEFAEREGCEMAVATGRRGWGRAAAATGWREHSYNFCKPLTRDADVE